LVATIAPNFIFLLLLVSGFSGVLLFGHALGLSLCYAFVALAHWICFCFLFVSLFLFVSGFSGVLLFWHALGLSLCLAFVALAHCIELRPACSRR
jgi:hypothetical protein